MELLNMNYVNNALILEGFVVNVSSARQGQEVVDFCTENYFRLEIPVGEL
jgi:hypothetical protein